MLGMSQSAWCRMPDGARLSPLIFISCFHKYKDPWRSPCFAREHSVVKFQTLISECHLPPIVPTRMILGLLHTAAANYNRHVGEACQQHELEFPPKT